jgi:hypothetical protein
MSQFGGYPEVVDIGAKVGQSAGVAPGDLVLIDLTSDDGYTTVDISALNTGGEWFGDYGVVLGRGTEKIGEGEDVIVRIQGPVDIAAVNGTIAIDDYLTPNWAGPANNLVVSAALTVPPTTVAHLVLLDQVIGKAEAANASGDGTIKVILFGRRGR